MEPKSKSKFPGNSISYARFRQKLTLKSQKILSELVVPVELYITTAKGRDVGKVDILRKSPFFWKHGPWAHSPPVRNKTSAMAVKNYPEKDITFLVLSCSLHFFNFLRIFCVASSA